MEHEVRVVGYLSGGVDSASVLATASRLRGKPLPSFTVRRMAAAPSPPWRRSPPTRCRRRSGRPPPSVPGLRAWWSPCPP